MPAAYTYTGTDDRYYPGIGREVRPGDSVTWDDTPGDGRWSPAVDPTASREAVTPDPAPAPAVEPAPEAAPAAPADTNGGAA